MQREDHVDRCNAFHLRQHCRLRFLHVPFGFVVPTYYEVDYGYSLRYTYHCYRIGVTGITTAIATIIGDFRSAVRLGSL
jgi:hypothetical protein